MEHPFRARIDAKDEPYTEQLVLMEGQGIWYYAPEDPEIAIRKANLTDKVDMSAEAFLRETFGFKSDWFIYFCPQSVFKMHPLFDIVIADILKSAVAAGVEAHVVVTGGRKDVWTEIYRSRLSSAIGPQLIDRLHLVPRVSAEKFLNLIKLADLLLHPFPFDGSRTSADGLSVGVPFLTMPTEFLRGRMGNCQTLLSRFTVTHVHAYYRGGFLPHNERARARG